MDKRKFRSGFYPSVLVASLLTAGNFMPFSPMVVEATAASESKLGDLSPFRAIVVDTMRWSTKAIFPQPKYESRTSKPPGTRPRQG